MRVQAAAGRGRTTELGTRRVGTVADVAAFEGGCGACEYRDGGGRTPRQWVPGVPRGLTGLERPTAGRDWGVPPPGVAGKDLIVEFECLGTEN